MNTNQHGEVVVASLDSETHHNPDTYRVVVVGIGAQGARITELMCQVGHDIVGVVDIGNKVGRRLNELVPGEKVPRVTVTDDLHGLLDRLDLDPDIVVLAPALGLDAILEMAGRILDRGINVITLQQDVLSRDDAWAIDMHRRAVTGGASFMASGVQDTWWVQMPALVAASSLDIRKIRITSDLSLQQLSSGVGAEVGVPLDPEAFKLHAEATRDVPSVLGAPMVEAARRMGATAGPVSKVVEPIIAESDYVWELGGITIRAGETCGMVETVRFATDRGIEFEGVVSIRPIPSDDAADRLDVFGTPEHHLEYRPFLGYDTTNVALISRIPDVIHSEPGMLFPAEMHAPKHHFSRR